MSSSCKRPHTCTVKPQCVYVLLQGGDWCTSWAADGQVSEWRAEQPQGGGRPSEWRKSRETKWKWSPVIFWKFSVLTETPQTKAELFLFLLFCCLPTMLCCFFLEWLMERSSFLLPRSAHSGFNMIHFDKNNVSHKYRSIVNLQVWKVKPTLRHQNMQFFNVQQRLQQWACADRLPC